MSARTSLEAFLCGAAVGAVCTYLWQQRYSSSSTADDDCHSLYYDTNLQDEGKGLPFLNTCDVDVKESLFSVKPEYKFLDKRFYKQAVELLPTVCVDIIVQRQKDKKVLLLYRRDKPVAEVWWWVGGRSFKGESFFQTAVRKTASETGADPSKVTPLGIVHVWNTFFPDSSWDDGREMGYAGCQTVNIVCVCKLNAADVNIDVEQQEKWAVAGHRWISIDEGLVEGKYDKYVRSNLLIARQKKLLL